MNLQTKEVMADMEIRYDKAAVKFLQGLPQKLRDSIREAIKGLTQVVEESVRMLEMLPESEQELASQLIKRLVLAGDPDFTTLTPEERCSW